ncbi:MAG TPA: 16S rRNA (cytidine(1402)-2'-O)-methyltransferase [Gammaproteobacteria bacterium]|nr:16S rRNA (cytidine(1402)-2'-O)-methyltransferase [Gammaproteobacteria bacterium]
MCADSNFNSKLYVVATPIGNLEDLSERAKKTLRSVNWIASEDTRHSQGLLIHFGIQKRCYSLHNFNEKKQTSALIGLLKEGQTGALISDAGTPLISDPGFHLIQAAHEAHIEVISIPGPCAAISALSVLAIQEGPIHFEGFLPAKKGSRIKRVSELRTLTSVLVFYESPHRIEALFEDLCQVLGGERFCGIGRELTKKFETLYRDSLENLFKKLQDQTIPIKGEFVIVVSGAQPIPQWEGDQRQLIQKLLTYLPITKAAKLAHEITGMDRKACYALALSLQPKPPEEEDSI